ncbi:MAG TPA: DUF1499 domain-containing protein [Nitrospira sp.]|nr:DUF1499 domain-containing protein [Nitrospira sp.]
MIRKSPDTVDFSTLRRPRSPNTFLVAPAGFTPAPVDLIAPEFPISAEALRQAWLAMLDEMPRVQILGPIDAAVVEAIQYTPVLRFPDRITARFIPLSNGRSTFAVYSRSRYGYSDFGVNRRRIRAWLTRLEERVLDSVRRPRPSYAAHTSMASPKLRK